MRHSLPALSIALSLGIASAADAVKYDYRVLATKKTSTLEKEMNEAADAGYRFSAVMGGETGFGGSEGVVLMAKRIGGGSSGKVTYKLLATSRTGTMHKEIQQAGDEGFDYRGQTVFASAFGGREVCVILERNSANGAQRFQYRLLATSRTSTMQKELQEAGEQGYEFLGMTVGKTAMGGSEVVCFLRRVAE